MRALIIYLLMICTSTLCAQTSAGTRFWCAFMENLNIAFNDAPVFRFEIETTDAATGVIQVPTTGLEIPFDIPANSIETVTLPDLIFYTIGTEVVDNKGLLITSDVPIRVSAFHNRAYFSESALLLPEPNLGQEYIVTCYKDDNDFSPTAFVVLATADNTTIEITPSVNTLGLRPANLPFTVELQAGENYQVKANEDLTGTRIQSLSGEPIAVFSGAQQANVELCSGADNHLYEQSLPLNDWADLYYFVPLQGQGGDIIKVVAATDNTLVFFDCAQVATLNAGESYTEKRLAATVITATAPIAVSQFNTSQSCNPSGIGDPNMLRLIPPNLQVDRVRFASPNTTSGLGFNYFTEHYVTVITATENINTIQLDGGGIALSFDPFPSDPDYSYAQVEVNPGKHLLSSTASFSAYSYGFGDFDAYSTHAGYGTTAEVNFACLDIQVEGLFCVDSLLQFTANANLPITTWDWSFGDGGVAT
ncbi:MAG: IgGFc-binding protein, partial [Bacteroidota bacterium]